MVTPASQNVVTADAGAQLLQRRPGDPLAAAADRPTVAAVQPGVTAVLALQRIVGNRAVGTMIGPDSHTLVRSLALSPGDRPPPGEAHRVIGATDAADLVLRAAVRERRARAAGAPPQLPAAGAPVERRSGRMLSRARRRACGVPSTSASTSVASAFGRAIEGLVDIAYMRDRGVSSTDVYFDALSVGTYVRFLSRKHGIPESTLRARVTRVPDLLDTRTTFSRSGRGEFYEIKPNSPSGTRAGRDKLHDIDAYMALTPPLPYERGSTWSPGTISIPIPLTAILTALSVIPGLGSLAGQLARAFLFCGAPDVTLEVRRTEPGLLQYRLCVEADLACYAEYAIAEDVLIAIIAIIILAPEVIPELVAEGPEIIAELPELIEEVGEIAPELPEIPELPAPGPPVMPPAPPIPVPVPVPAPPP